MTSIGIIGAGAWGTVIANILAENGHDVCLWCYKASIAEGIAAHQSHHRLPDVTLSSGIQVTTDLAQCYDHDLLILGLSSGQLVQYASRIDWKKIQSSRSCNSTRIA